MSVGGLMEMVMNLNSLECDAIKFIALGRWRMVGVW